MKFTKYLTVFNCWISSVIWLPAWIKMIQTRSSHDYSVLSMALILWLQCTNLLIAVLDKSRNLKIYLIVNTATVAFTLAMVIWFQR